MNENGKMQLWESLCRPPVSALKEIEAGRLKGKSDISPQWRLRVMTETFGPVGIGWRYYIERLWTEPGPNDQVFAFATVIVQVKQGDEWSEQIPGIGGHMLVVKEKSGLYANDEAYKMAVTDALSVALKSLGVAADIYEGKFDGSKYTDDKVPQKPESKPDPQKHEWNQLVKMMGVVGEDLSDDNKAHFRERFGRIEKGNIAALSDMVEEMKGVAVDDTVEQL